MNDGLRSLIVVYGILEPAQAFVDGEQFHDRAPGGHQILQRRANRRANIGSGSQDGAILLEDQNFYEARRRSELRLERPQLAGNGRTIQQEKSRGRERKPACGARAAGNATLVDQFMGVYLMAGVRP